MKNVGIIQNGNISPVHLSVHGLTWHQNSAIYVIINYELRMYVGAAVTNCECA